MLKFNTHLNNLNGFFQSLKYKNKITCIFLIDAKNKPLKCHCPNIVAIPSPCVRVYVCTSRCRSEPVPSPRTRTRVMTTPATVSSYIWTPAMRFLSSWMAAKPTVATATNTAPSQGSSSMPTEGREPE